MTEKSLIEASGRVNIFCPCGPFEDKMYSSLCLSGTLLNQKQISIRFYIRITNYSLGFKCLHDYIHFHLVWQYSKGNILNKCFSSSFEILIRFMVRETNKTKPNRYNQRLPYYLSQTKLGQYITVCINLRSLNIKDQMCMQGSLLLVLPEQLFNIYSSVPLFDDHKVSNLYIVYCSVFQNFY